MSKNEFSMTTYEKDDFVVLVVKGECIAGNNAPNFGTKLKELCSKTNKIVINMKNLNCIMTAGMGILVSNLSNIRNRGGDIIVAGISNKIKMVFEKIGFDQIIKIFPTVEEVSFEDG